VPQVICLNAVLKSRFLHIWSRDSVVGTATGDRLDDRGGRSSSPGRVKDFLFSTSSRPVLGSTQPIGTGRPFPWDKAAGV
jgi:hypothetical protein